MSVLFPTPHERSHYTRPADRVRVRHWIAAWVGAGVAYECIRQKRVFCSTFPVFIPSLSWQTFGCFSLKWNQKGVSAAPIETRPQPPTFPVAMTVSITAAISCNKQPHGLCSSV